MPGWDKTSHALLAVNGRTGRQKSSNCRQQVFSYPLRLPRTVAIIGPILFSTCRTILSFPGASAVPTTSGAAFQRHVTCPVSCPVIGEVSLLSNP